MGRMYNIYRCLECGGKAHRRYWKNNHCPYCDSAVGYSVSSHGGLTYQEIEEARAKLKRAKLSKVR